MPRSQSAAAVRLGTAITRTPGTRTASAAFNSATMTLPNPASTAAATAGRTPRTGRSRPSKPSSPKNITPSTAALGTLPAAASTPMAMARSNQLPRLGKLAGESPTVIFRCGHSSPLLTIAARIRSRASRSAVSGRPTRIVPTRPFAMSASTSTTWPVTPTKATEWVRASGTATPPRGCARRRTRRCRRRPGRPRRCGPGRTGLRGRSATALPACADGPAWPG